LFQVFSLEHFGLPKSARAANDALGLLPHSAARARKLR
jgi:hypothetical protein